MRRLWMLVLLLLLAGCGPSVGLPRVSSPMVLPTTAPATSTAAPPVTATVPPPAVTQTATQLPYEACAYTWATQDLPEVSAQLTKAMKDAGFGDIEARAAAYGENCVNPKTNKVDHFSAMQTDFYLIVPVVNTKDTEVSGGWIAQLLPVLDRFPPGQVPGPNLGQVSIRFTDSAGEDNLWFPLKTGQDLLKQGLKGKALYDALKNKAP